MISMRNLLKCSAVLCFRFRFSRRLPPKSRPLRRAPKPAADAAKAAAARRCSHPGNWRKPISSVCLAMTPNLQVQFSNISLSPIPEMYDITALFVTPEGQQASHWYVSKDLKHAIAGDVLPFGADPFARSGAKLAKSAFGPTKGPADAKLLIVEFADLECPACKEAAPVMEKLRNDFPQARFVFQSFPLAQLHPWAVRASSYLDCIARANQDQAFTFMEAVFTHQKEIEDAVRKTDAGGKTTVDDAAVTERLRHYAEMAGADPGKDPELRRDSGDRRTHHSQPIARPVRRESPELQRLFINGRRVGNPGVAQYEALKAVVAFEAEQAAKYTKFQSFVGFEGFKVSQNGVRVMQRRFWFGG